MVKLWTATPLWLARRRPRQRYAPLGRDITADVVIIGGGMTGATIASMFAINGARVALLEAGLVGTGSTAASTALLLQEPDESLGDLAKRYGHRQAVRIWELSHAAVREFTATLREHRIACDLAERDTVYYTTKRTAIRSLREEYRQRRTAGFRSEWLDAPSLQAASGVIGEAALLTIGNRQFDPYRACFGLIRVAHRAGARIFERSKVTAIEKESEGVHVRTSKGSVSASHVIVATGYATPAFKPLAGRFRMKNTYVLATEPVAARTRQRCELKDVMMWDVERPYHYVRWTHDHRLLLGGGDINRVPESRRRQKFRKKTRGLHEHFERIMPGLRGLPLDYRWEGLFAMTPDGLPYIGPHSRYRRHLFALGYGGNGMTLGFQAAQFLWQMVQGQHSSDHALFAFDRFSRP